MHFSVKVSILLREELKIYPVLNRYFWIDSQVVLGYVNNDWKWFKGYFASRIQMILEHLQKSQWDYIKSMENQLIIQHMAYHHQVKRKIKRWISGRKILWKNKLKWSLQKLYFTFNQRYINTSPNVTEIFEYNCDFHI